MQTPKATETNPVTQDAVDAIRRAFAPRRDMTLSGATTLAERPICETDAPIPIESRPLTL